MNKEMYYSVDEIEGVFAVLEYPDGTFKNVPLCDLPVDIKEGSLLKKAPDGTFTLDFDEEKRRKMRISDLQDKIFG